MTALIDEQKIMFQSNVSPNTSLDEARSIVELHSPRMGTALIALVDLIQYSKDGKSNCNNDCRNKI